MHIVWKTLWTSKDATRNKVQQSNKRQQMWYLDNYDMHCTSEGTTQYEAGESLYILHCLCEERWRWCQKKGMRQRKNVFGSDAAEWCKPLMMDWVYAKTPSVGSVWFARWRIGDDGVVKWLSGRWLNMRDEQGDVCGTGKGWVWIVVGRDWFSHHGVK